MPPTTFIREKDLKEEDHLAEVQHAIILARCGLERAG
jgi:hypothetical protein